MILFLLACSASENEAFLLTGWHYEWELLSHRVSLLRAGVEPDSSLQLGLVGGTWSTGEEGSDTPFYTMRVEHVRTPDAWFQTGTIDLSVGPEGSAQATIDVADELPETDGLVAFIRGFTINTDVEQSADYPDNYDPSYGYTSQGFGFGLGTPVRSGGQIQVPVEASVRWAPQDRDDMNGAIPYATTGVEVAYTLVAYNGSIESAELENEAEYPVENPDASIWSYTDQPPMEQPLSFAGDGREGFVGWTRFDLGANQTGEWSEEGDYLRAFGVEAIPTADDKGSWEGDCVATLSTSSAIELTVLTAHFSGTAVRIGTRNATVEHYEASGTHPVGWAQTEPLLENN